jgi:hypothetical protein
MDDIVRSLQRRALPGAGAAIAYPVRSECIRGVVAQRQ